MIPVYIYVWLQALLISVQAEEPAQSDRIVFGLGEELTYKVHYGFVNAANARMVISDQVHVINGKKCYKIDVYGESIGMFDLFLRIRDNWGTYLDTGNVVPQRFYRHIEEGKYRKNEIVDFNYNRREASVRTFDKKKKVWKPAEKFPIPGNVQDLVSGYYYLRTLDFNNLDDGDVIRVNAFFDKELYDFKIRIVGRELVKTKLGEIRSIVISPIMPENGLFDGENSIRVWISDDINKVPLKIKAQMFVGAVEVDIETFVKGNVN